MGSGVNSVKTGEGIGTNDRIEPLSRSGAWWLRRREWLLHNKFSLRQQVVVKDRALYVTVNIGIVQPVRAQMNHRKREFCLQTSFFVTVTSYHAFELVRTVSSSSFTVKVAYIMSIHGDVHYLLMRLSTKQSFHTRPYVKMRSHSCLATSRYCGGWDRRSRCWGRRMSKHSAAAHSEKWTW